MEQIYNFFNAEAVVSILAITALFYIFYSMFKNNRYYIELLVTYILCGVLALSFGLVIVVLAFIIIPVYYIISGISNKKL